MSFRRNTSQKATTSWFGCRHNQGFLLEGQAASVLKRSGMPFLMRLFLLLTTYIHAPVMDISIISPFSTKASRHFTHRQPSLEQLRQKSLRSFCLLSLHTKFRFLKLFFPFTAPPSIAPCSFPVGFTSDFLMGEGVVG